MGKSKSARETRIFIAILVLMLTLTCPRASALPGGEHQGRFFYTQASWYSNVETKNRRCADGRWYDLSKEFVAASWTYRLGTRLKIKCVGGEKLVVVVVRDRGPAKRLCKVGRCIDLSKAAFAALESDLSKGLIDIVVEEIK